MGIEMRRKDHVMNVNEELLATKLQEVARLLPDSGDLRELLESFLRTAGDAEVVRINPVAFAGNHGCDEAALIRLFLHGRKIGLLRMEWQYVCPGCGDIVESFQSPVVVEKIRGAQNLGVFRGSISGQQADPLLVALQFAIQEPPRRDRSHIFVAVRLRDQQGLVRAEMSGSCLAPWTVPR